MRTELGSDRVRRLLSAGCVVAALVVSFTGFGATANAQGPARAKIDFAFVAGGKEMPAGTYEFEVTEWRVIVRSAGGKVPAIMPVITRLGRHDTDAGTELVFDKVGDKFILSELWLARQDGYLLVNTPVDHEHRVVGGSRPHM